MYSQTPKGRYYRFIRIQCRVERRGTTYTAEVKTFESKTERQFEETVRFVDQRRSS